MRRTESDHLLLDMLTGNNGHSYSLNFGPGTDEVGECARDGREVSGARGNKTPIHA